MKEKIISLFKGEVTISKLDLWLIGGLCLFTGVVFGLVKAPWTHGVTIGSYNGNGYGGQGDCECIDESCFEEE